MKERKLNNEGFSLIELIVVIAIMAILVGALAPQYLKFVEKSRVSKDMQNVSQLKTAIEVYAAGNDAATDATITFSKSTKTISVTDAVATDAGISASTKMGTDKWSDDVSFTYQIADGTYKWTGPSKGAIPSSTATAAGQTYDIADVFK